MQFISVQETIEREKKKDKLLENYVCKSLKIIIVVFIIGKRYICLLQLTTSDPFIPVTQTDKLN